MSEIFVLKDARACFRGDKFVVLAGSKASLTWATTNSTTDRSNSINIRNVMIRNGDLELSQSEACYVFSKDYEFNKPTPAADVVNGHPTSGTQAWKVCGSTKTLRTWLDEQLGDVK
ncbi:hypothetical protein TRM7557_03594 [Tritonibacter multivorans]|uniref:DUF4357 domain-containing protein n=1 Tax=Tritonibacter multivorans TaxID=928856 RepID=A0A0P1GII2_9RHOB|nr:DUF4357 domain-containing protein [Tritonibacter multivorans]MDA7420351.1 DUF4357 domain-containing protein [Tritonibacter multivorans]CUH81760.1 hypothetical protein TRM7557_03594 [Tritonibacter multivorans]SFC43138.1 protein of unknown function [Tritonibacter multivorans]